MAVFTISALSGRVLAELPLDDAALDLVVCDLLERLPPPTDGAGGVPRLLLGPRELGWSEPVADLGLAPGAVLTSVIVPDPEKAAADLLGAESTPVRLAAARALHAMGAKARRQAGALADAVLSDPDAEVVGEAMQALRAMGAAAKSRQAGGGGEYEWRMAKLAQDLEDPGKVHCVADPDLMLDLIHSMTDHLLALLALCGGSPGQAALRSWTVVRRLAPLVPEAARLLGEPLDDPRPEVRLARVAVLAGTMRSRHMPVHEVEDAAAKLCSVLQRDACLGVRRRAAGALGAASWKRGVAPSAALAREAIAAEAEALRTSSLPADRCRMEAVQSLQQLLR